MGSNSQRLAYRVTLNLWARRLLLGSRTGKRLRFRSIAGNHGGNHVSIHVLPGIQLVSYTFSLVTEYDGRCRRISCDHLPSANAQSGIADRIRFDNTRSNDFLLVDAARQLRQITPSKSVLGPPRSNDFRYGSCFANYGACAVSWTRIDGTPLAFPSICHDSSRFHPPNTRWKAGGKATQRRDCWVVHIHRVLSRHLIDDR